MRCCGIAGTVHRMSPHGRAPDISDGTLHWRGILVTNITCTTSRVQCVTCQHDGVTYHSHDVCYVCCCRLLLVKMLQSQRGLLLASIWHHCSPASVETTPRKWIESSLSMMHITLNSSSSSSSRSRSSGSIYLHSAIWSNLDIYHCC